MKYTIFAGLLIAALLAGCGAIPGAQPTPTATVTTTPSYTPTALPTDTLTPLPTKTAKPTRTATSTKTPKPTKTPQPKEVEGCFAPNGMNGPTAPFKIENYTNRKVTVYINGASRNGNYPIYCTEFVRQGIPPTLTLMFGNYTYMIQFSGKTTVNGTFYINDTDKATMRIFTDKIQIGPFP